MSQVFAVKQQELFISRFLFNDNSEKKQFSSSAIWKKHLYLKLLQIKISQLNQHRCIKASVLTMIFETESSALK